MTRHELKALRVQSGLTQEQLAEKTGISVSMIRAMEQGQRPIKDSHENLIRLTIKSMK